MFKVRFLMGKPLKKNAPRTHYNNRPKVLSHRLIYTEMNLLTDSIVDYSDDSEYLGKAIYSETRGIK